MVVSLFLCFRFTVDIFYEGNTPREVNGSRDCKDMHSRYADNTDYAQDIRMRRAPKRQSKIGLLLIVIAMLVTVIANGVRVASLKAKSERLAVTERQLETEIEDAHKKADDLAEKEKYMQTKKYIEDEAKDKLGLVYPDEIVIEPREK